MTSSSSASPRPSKEEIEDELKGAGNRLLTPPSSVDELLALLDKVEGLLSKVSQAPPKSMQDALLPPMMALIANEMLKHSDINVQLSVLSCISEITRITAPDASYNDEQMKDIFKLIVKAFDELSHGSGHCYSKAVQILETVASVRSCLLMLDLECDDLIVEMFHRFFNIIRCDHPHDIFANMEKIMTLVIKESEEISLELLRPLLASVKKENQDVSPLSSKLGENVLKNCADILTEYLPEAVKFMNLVFDDYAEIVTLICQDAPGREPMVGKEGEPDVICQEVGHGPSELVVGDDIAQMKNYEILEDKNPMKASECHQSQVQNTSNARNDFQLENSDVMGDDNGQIKNNEILEDTNSIKSSECRQNEEQNNSNPINDFQLEKSDARQAMLPEKDFVEVTKKRGRKPNSLIKPEEGYDHSWINGRKKSLGRSWGRKNRQKKLNGTPENLTRKESAMRSEPDEETTVLSPNTLHCRNISASLCQNYSIAVESHPKRGRPRMKESIMSKGCHLDLSSVPEENLLESQQKGKSSELDDALKRESGGKLKLKSQRKSRKNLVVPMTNVETILSHKKRKGISSDPEGKQESFFPEVDGQKQSMGTPTREKHVTEESRDKKMVIQSSIKPLDKDESCMEKSSNKKIKRKWTPRKEKNLIPRVIKDCGKELVGCRIKVWWPLDQMFYEGMISSFDSLSKRHGVLYADGDEENLELSKERWELLGDEFPDQASDLPASEQEAGLPSPSISVKRQKKKAKKVPKSSIKQEKTASSSRRFSEGGISFSDPLNEKHKVQHPAGNEEILDLNKEHWELIDDKLPDHARDLLANKQEARLPCPAISVKHHKKKAKTGSKVSAKQEKTVYSSRFYEGMVSSSHPLHKKSKVLCVDEEILDSGNECRELLGEELPDQASDFPASQQEQEAGLRSLSIKHKKKVVKTGSKSSIKQEKTVYSSISSGIPADKSVVIALESGVAPVGSSHVDRLKDSSHGLLDDEQRSASKPMGQTAKKITKVKFKTSHSLTKSTGEIPQDASESNTVTEKHPKEKEELVKEWGKENFEI